METIILQSNKRYSFADYLTWADNVRRELFDGIVKLMSPAPSLKHQICSGNLYFAVKKYLLDKNCTVLYAQSDVRFPQNETDLADDKVFTVVQPDIFVVCDKSKLDERGCLGAPDWIIEIVSPKNSRRDVKDKFDLYEKYGIREYWIVNPSDENVNVFILQTNGTYNLRGMYAENDEIPVNIFDDDLKVNLTKIFENE